MFYKNNMSTNIVETNSEEIVMTSLEFSKLTGKEHSNILKAINNLSKDLRNLWEDTQVLDTYSLPKGRGMKWRQNKIHNLTKRYCELLAMNMDRKIQIKVYDKMKELEIQLNKPMTELERAKQQVVLLERLESQWTRINTLLDDRLNIKSQELNKANRKIWEMKSQIDLLNKQSIIDKAFNKLPNIWRLEDTYPEQDYNNVIRLNIYDSEWECIHEWVTVKETCDLLNTNISSTYKVLRWEIWSIQWMYQLRRIY